MIVSMSMPGTLSEVSKATYRSKLAVSTSGLLYNFPSPYGNCDGLECFSELTIAGKTYQNVIKVKQLIPVADSVQETQLYYNNTAGIIQFNFPDGRTFTLE